MKAFKNSLVLSLIFVVIISVGSFSNISFAKDDSKSAIKDAQSIYPELKSGYNLKLDKSPTISFKKKNSKKLLIKMKDGTGFKSIRYQYKKGNKDDNLAKVSRKNLKKS